MSFEAREQAKGFLSRLFRPRVKEGATTEKEILMKLNPEEAAEHVFKTLTTEEGGRVQVLELGRIYGGDSYSPECTGNALLTFGSRWYNLDNPPTVRALRTGLQALFNIELVSDDASQVPEREFVRSLGVLVQNLVKQTTETH